MGFEDRYEKITECVAGELNLLKTLINEELSGLNSGVEKFDVMLTKFIGSKSKHIRPVLAFLYLKSKGLEVDEKQIKFQAVIELIHNASLIHDDVIDGSQVRRSEKSLNANLGNHLSVIGGDFVLSYVLKYLVDLGEIELLEMVAKTMEKMCLGEVKQYYSRYAIPTLEEYLEKTYAKTGALFCLALSGAEYLASGKVSDETEEFAKNFGTAFQIRDDIKNIVNNIPNGDIANGIYTAPVIFSGDITEPLAGVEKAKSLLDNYIRKSAFYLNQSDNVYKRALTELLELVDNE